MEHLSDGLISIMMPIEVFYELFVCGPFDSIHKLSYVSIGGMPDNFGEPGLSGEEYFISYESLDSTSDSLTELENKREAITQEIYIRKASGITVSLVRWVKRGNIINQDCIIME